MARTELTHEHLTTVLAYDPKAGIFVRKACVSWTGKLVAKSGAGSVGKQAGCLKSHGYVAIYVGGREYYAHRLAWFYVHGAWPDGMIDHINGCRNDNRIANLRVATAQENAENIRNPRAKSGLMGVVFDSARNKFVAYIRVGGRSINLGGFGTAEEAHAAYLRAKREHHEFATI